MTIPAQVLKRLGIESRMQSEARPGHEDSRRNHQPEGQGRVIVESDKTVYGGTIPDSAARAQVRDFRAADPRLLWP